MQILFELEFVPCHAALFGDDCWFEWQFFSLAQQLIPFKLQGFPVDVFFDFDTFVVESVSEVVTWQCIFFHSFQLFLGFLSLHHGVVFLEKSCY